MNHVVIIGNLTRDIELKYTQSGKAVANFTLAVTDRFNKEKTDFLECVTWNKQAELCAQYLSKGKKAGVVGRISTRNYENKDGHKVKVTEIVVDEVEFLSPKGDKPPATKADAEDQWESLGREVRLEDIDLPDTEEIPF
jgi:single-strand DNA-binding protein